MTAALMTGKVRNVIVLDANREHVGALRDPGLKLDRLGEESTVRLDAYDDPDDLPARADFALVTLKAAYLEPALTPLRDADRAETFVSLGNGLVQDRTLIGRLGATKASMLQDIERGVPCEVDVINGAVAERGREHGIPTPLNDGIVELVHGYERGGAEPGPGALETLSTRLR